LRAGGLGGKKLRESCRNPAPPKRPLFNDRLDHDDYFISRLAAAHALVSLDHFGKIIRLGHPIYDGAFVILEVGDADWPKPIPLAAGKTSMAHAALELWLRFRQR
jgi:hypothetical protein